MPSIDLNGVAISYVDEGEGDALLLVHGWIGSGALWDLMLPGLVADFRVVAPDLPGHGDSGIPAGFSFDLAGFSRFLEQIRAVLGLGRPALVGHSMGGSICLHYAANYPGQVDKLALIDTPARAGALSWPARLPFLEYGLAAASLCWGPHLVSPLIRSSVTHPERLPRDWLRRAVAQASKLDRRALLETTRLVRHLDLERELTRVEAPALIIHGEEDGSVKPAEASRLREALPGARLRMLPDCGHCPNYEYPSEVNDMVREFLSGG